MMRTTWLFRSALLAALSASAGCGDELRPPPAEIPVLQQVVNLHARSSGDTLACAYSIMNLAEVSCLIGNRYDVLFDVGPDDALFVGTTGDTVAVLRPGGMEPSGPWVSMQRSAIPYDSIKAAPVSGYSDGSVAIRAGDALIVASVPVLCTTGLTSPRYAKLHVQSIDFAARTVSFLATIDPNCGYRSFEQPGAVPSY